MAKILIADELSPRALEIFRSRGLDVDVNVGLKKPDLIRIIADGGPVLGKSPQTPAYRNTLTQVQIKAVVAYIRAIAEPPYQSPARER